MYTSFYSTTSRKSQRLIQQYYPFPPNITRTSSSVQIKCTIHLHIHIHSAYTYGFIVLNINLLQSSNYSIFYIKSPLTASRAVSRTIILNHMHQFSFLEDIGSQYMCHFVSFDLLVVIKKTYLLNVSMSIMDNGEYIWIGANHRPPFSLMAVTTPTYRVKQWRFIICSNLNMNMI